MMRRLLQFLLFLWLASTATAMLRTSVGNGPWGEIQWTPAGAPQQGDQVLINSAVTGMPDGRYGWLTINAGASLAVPQGTRTVAGLTNNGTLSFADGASLTVYGNAVNDGAITGNGAIEITLDGAVISGGGAFQHLLLNAPPGSMVSISGGVVLGSLYVAPGNQLHVGVGDLTVNGSYSSAEPFGLPGITSTGGAIILNGSVYGSAEGEVRFGWVPASPRSHGVPTTYGSFGDVAKSVRFAASRQLSFSRLVGTVTVDSGVTLWADGIGPNGGNSVAGSLRIQGTLSALDDEYLWSVEGDLYNEGTVDNCTIRMSGHRLSLHTENGLWGNGASLSFYGDSQSELQLTGSLTVPRLIVDVFDPLDSDVVLNCGRSPLLVRHLLMTNQGRGCMVVTDSVVAIRGDARGVVQGDVSFEGFWDSEIGGSFGGGGHRVRMAMPKRIAFPFVADGLLEQRPNALLRVGSTASLPAGTILQGELVIEPAGRVTVDGSLTAERTISGGGALEILGTSPVLDIREGIRDSVLLEVGRDTISTELLIPRTFTVPRMTVHSGSQFRYHAGDSVNVTGEFRYRMLVGEGFSMLSAAAIPADGRAESLFPGADSHVFRFDDALGYTVADSVNVGEGYWVSFPAPMIIEQQGRIVNAPRSLAVKNGWNIIGSASIPVLVDNIGVDGATRDSDFFQFIGGYGPAAAIEPGHGYWVKFNGGGYLVLHPEP